MKMTKDRKSWSPEFWQASGSLGIDLNGLDISGTVDAAYYRAGTEVPGTVLTLPDIGSSNVIDGSITDDQTETTDTTQPVDSTDDIGSTEAVDSTEQTDPADDTASSQVETADATEATTADELTAETDAVSARETTESTAGTEIATAIDTDSDDSTQTVASTTDVTDITTEASTTAGSTDITTEATTDATTETTDATGGIAEDETFDVDTIFTSGTFEIAGGGGNPEDSIFQGEVELAQMKMTKDRKSWSPEFWQASGSLGIDLNGLDISGTVDAAYYRAGTEVPGSVLTLPDIGSSNVIDGSTTDDQTETTDTTQPVDSTDDSGSAEAIDSTEQTEPAEDTASSEVVTTDAAETTTTNEQTDETDALARETTELTDITTDASTDATTETTDATDGIAKDETFDVDTIFTSGTFEIAAGGGNPDDSIFQGEVELAQMKMTRDEGSWSPEFWQASGSLGIDLNGLDISGTVDAAYYRAGTEVPESVLTLPEIGSSNNLDEADR